MINKIFYLALIATLTSCIDYKDVELVGLEDVQLAKVSGDGIEADIWIKVNNPNKYNIKVNTKDLIFYVNGKKIGKAVLKKSLELEKKGIKTYQTQLVVSVPEDGNIDLGLIVLMSGGKINLQLKGEIVGKAKGISKTIPVDISESISF